MAVPAPIRPHDWTPERDGYIDVRRVAYAPAPLLHCKQSLRWVRAEERISSLIAGAGVIWGVRVSTGNLSNLDALWQTPGPLQVCGIGVLIWLHAKWRRSVAVR